MKMEEQAPCLESMVPAVQHGYPWAGIELLE